MSSRAHRCAPARIVVSLDCATSRVLGGLLAPTGGWSGMRHVAPPASVRPDSGRRSASHAGPDEPHIRGSLLGLLAIRWRRDTRAARTVALAAMALLA